MQWLKRIFGGDDTLPELSDSKIDTLISWSHRQLILHDELLPHSRKGGPLEGIAAWVSIPPLVALRCLGYSDKPDEKLLNHLEAGIGEIGTAYALGDWAKDDDLAEVVSAFSQHAKLFLVFWLKAFAKFEPRSTFRNLPMLSSMLTALLDSPRHGLTEHLSLHDRDDRHDYAESMANLINRCYAAMPELEAEFGRVTVAPDAGDTQTSTLDAAHKLKVDKQSMEDRGIFEASGVYCQLASISGDGMWLEIYLADASGRMNSARQYPMACIRADAGDDRKFEVMTPEGTYSVPLYEMELAIEAAKEDVHSEDYYDRQTEDD